MDTKDNKTTKSNKNTLNGKFKSNFSGEQLCIPKGKSKEDGHYSRRKLNFAISC